MSDRARQVFERAYAFIDLRRYEEAAATARSGLADDPDDRDLVLMYAYALTRTSDVDEALRAARRAVALCPDSEYSHYVLGRALLQSGDHAAAASQALHALKIDPHRARTHVLRADALLWMVERRPRQTDHRDELLAQAEWHAAEAIRSEPTNGAGYRMHAHVCVVRGDAKGIEAWSRRALELEPDHPSSHELLGYAAELRGDLRSAADHYVDAARLDPSREWAMSQLRNVGLKVPVGYLAASLVTVVALVAGRAAGGSLLDFGVAFVLTVVAYRTAVAYGLFGTRWRNRRQLSSKAIELRLRDHDLRT